MNSPARFACPSGNLPAQSHEPPATFYRLGGLLIAAGISTAFWVLMLKFLANAHGVPIGAPGLLVFGLVIAALCFLSAAVVMADRHDA